MDSLTQLAAAVLAACSVALLGAGAAAHLRRRPFRRRLATYVFVAPREERRPEGRARAGARIAPRVRRRLARSGLAERIQPLLMRAGLELTPSAFLLLVGGTGSAAALLGLAVGGGPAAGRLAAAALFGLLGAAAPLLVVRRRAQKRQVEFEMQLPQAIDAIAATLQAGSTLTQALEVIAREMLPPMSAELRRLLREVDLGLPLSEGLQNMLERVPSDDLMMLVSAIDIQHRVGGDLAYIMRGISHTVRERLRIRGETRVLTAQARYSSYIIAGLPVLLFAFLWLTNYDYLSGLFESGLTQMLFGGAVAGVVFGFFLMNKIASVEV